MTVQITRLTDAEPTCPPGHTNVQPLLLQGGPHAPTTDLVVLLSHYLPGGRADPEVMTTETVYVVVAGQLTVSADGTDTTLHPYDSVRIDPGTIRALENRGPLPTSIIVVRSTHTT